MNEQFLQRALNGCVAHGPALTTWVLLAAIAWVGAHVFWQLWPAQRFDAPNFNIMTSERTNTQSSYSAKDIINAHWFGVYTPEENATEAPALDAGEPLNETELKLTLMGAIANEDPTLGLAIIRDDAGKEQRYFVGDAVTGQTKLHSVFARKVVLSRNGVLEELRLPVEFMDAPKVRRTSSRPSSAKSPIKAISQTDLALFLTMARPVPKYNSQGDFEGVRLYAGKERRAFIKAGLRPGDLVTEVNGQTFGNLNDAMNTLSALNLNDSVTATVLRNGEATTITVNLSEALGELDDSDGPIT